MTARRHLDALTGIRGLAAWGVVLYHIRLSLVNLLPGEVIAVLGKGYLAVDLFFVLSGFVIWYNYAARLSATGWDGVPGFLWRRFARVWPLHAAILGLFGVFALALALKGKSTAGYPLGELPAHVLLIQNWGLTPDLSWNHPAWSISTEFAAYLAFPLIVAVLARRRLSLGTLLGAAMLLGTALHALFRLTGHDQLGEAIAQMGLWRCLGEFTMGALLCLVWERCASRPGASAWGWSGLLAILAGAWIFAPAESAIVPMAFFTGLLALALDQGLPARLLSSRIMVYLGEISYSTYLAHFGLFIVYKMIFVDASLQLGWGQLAGFLALVLTVSAGLYHGLEKPAQRWLIERAPAWSRPARPVAAK